MPAVAAHYQFGTLVKNALNGSIRTCIENHLNYFQLGTQGPDLLFYHKPLTKNKIASYGVEIHTQPGEQFLHDLLIRQPNLDERQIAYLLGFYCHYNLDRACHPYIDQCTNHITKEHMSLESDFDYFVIQYFSLSMHRFRYLPIIKDVEPIAIIYDSPVTSIKKSVKTFRMFTKLFEYKSTIYYLEKLIFKQEYFSFLCMKSKLVYLNECNVLLNLFQETQPNTCIFLEELYNLLSTRTGIIKNARETFNGTLL